MLCACVLCAKTTNPPPTEVFDCLLWSHFRDYFLNAAVCVCVTVCLCV